jgi:hypothetical protein
LSFAHDNFDRRNHPAAAMKDGVTMKRTAYIWLGGTILAGAVSLAGAQSDSLGDYARANRKENKPAAAKTYDNDNLPRTQNLSVVGQASEPTADGMSADAQALSPNGNNGAPDKKADNGGWKAKIAEQQSKIDLLSRELDVAQREYRLRAAVMYADAGNRLRNAGSWDKEDANYKKQIADKQKAVEDAKKSLADIQEQARKAGDTKH